CQHYYSSPSSC
nr:immunoglobulin light chain junction region [Macaca mulatta]